MNAQKETFNFSVQGVVVTPNFVFSFFPVITWTPTRPFRMEQIGAIARVTDAATFARNQIAIPEVYANQSGVSGQIPSGVFTPGSGVSVPLFTYLFNSSDLIEVPGFEFTAGTPIIFGADVWSNTVAFTAGDFVYLRLIITGEYV